MDMKFDKLMLNTLLLAGLYHGSALAEDPQKASASVKTDSDLKRLVCYKDSNRTIYNHGLSTGLVITADAAGTGFIIGKDNLFLTTRGAVNTQTGEAVTGDLWLNYHHEKCDDNDNKVKNVVKVKIEKLLASGKASVNDYALLSIDPFDFKYANIKRVFGGLEMSKKNPDQGEALYIPQQGTGVSFPALVSDKRNGSPCKLLHLTVVLGYNCEVMSGAYGAPVLSQASHKVVGINYSSNPGSADENFAISAEASMKDLSAFITDENNHEQPPLQYEITSRYVKLSSASYQGELVSSAQPVWFVSSDPALKIEHMDKSSLATFMKQDQKTGSVEEDKIRPLKLWLENDCGKYPINEKATCDNPGKTRLMYSMDMTKKDNAAESPKKFWLLLTQNNEQGTKEEYVINLMENS